MADQKVVFIAFAIEDERQRDFLTGQSLLTKSPFARNKLRAGQNQRERSELPQTAPPLHCIVRRPPHASHWRGAAARDPSQATTGPAKRAAAPAR